MSYFCGISSTRYLQPPLLSLVDLIYDLGFEVGHSVNQPGWNNWAVHRYSTCHFNQPPFLHLSR